MPPKSQYVSSMNLAELTQIATHEKINIEGLKSKNEILKAIQASTTAVSKKYDLGNNRWITLDEASVIPSTQGMSVENEEDDTVEQLKMINEAKAKNLEKGRISETLRKYYDNLIKLVNTKKITKAQLEEKIHVMNTERRPRMENEIGEKAERDDLNRRMKNAEKLIPQTPVASPAPPVVIGGKKAPAVAPVLPVGKKAPVPPVGKLPPAPAPPQIEPEKTDKVFKPVNFQKLTQHQNLKPKVIEKQVTEQITESDLITALKRQQNRLLKMGTGAKLRYNYAWGKTQNVKNLI